MFRLYLAKIIVFMKKNPEIISVTSCAKLLLKTFHKYSWKHNHSLMITIDS